MAKAYLIWFILHTRQYTTSTTTYSKRILYPS